MTFELLTPYPERALPLAWEWLREYPAQNFDDYGPATYQEFAAEMGKRAVVETTWAVATGGRICGIVAYLPYTPRSGTFHGICFSQEVHNTGLAAEAVAAILAGLFASGAEKVAASFFADNDRVRHFLSKLGAVDEGLLRKQTVRGGIAIDMRLVAFFKE